MGHLPNAGLFWILYPRVRPYGHARSADLIRIAGGSPMTCVSGGKLS